MKDNGTYGLTTNQRLFRFVLKNPNINATKNKAGFIDSMKVQDYVDFDDIAGTLDKNTAKALGYLRWINLSLFLSKFGINYLEINDLIGADALNPPEKIIFTVGYNQADSMYYKNSKGTVFIEEDENESESSPVQTIENVEYVSASTILKMIVADCLINDYKSIMEVWNPTIDTSGRNPSGRPIGMITPMLSAEKLISSIEEIDDVVDSIEEIEYPYYNKDDYES